jgi:hypothetical protein
MIKMWFWWILIRFKKNVDITEIFGYVFKTIQKIMNDLQNKLNELEKRLSGEIKDLRGLIEKEKAPAKELILGGMFEIERIEGDMYLTDKHLDRLQISNIQIKQLRVIDKIIQMTCDKSYSIPILNNVFLEAEELGLKF